ncbi:MAG: DNA methyltransferase [Gemmataceae bacterium]
MRHRFHALCPYFAMFPESFAETWIERLSEPGDVIFDPFSGRGTTAFQSLLMGRGCLACDVNDVAYCVTKAKVNAPSQTAVIRRLNALEAGYVRGDWLRAARGMPEFFQHCYSRRTLAQILYLRDTLDWRNGKTDCMIAALVLGVLHGETHKSPSYLSNQMPRTISTKPVYSVKFWRDRGLVAPERDAFELLNRQARYRYESDPPKGDAVILHRDMRHLAWMKDKLPAPLNLAITSPPYLDVTNFEEDQWLRLWFLGGPPHPTRHRVSRDDRYEREDGYWTFVADMWRMLGAVMAKTANVVIRLGARGLKPDLMTERLIASSQFSQRRIKLVSQSSSALQKRQTDSFRPGTKGCLVEVDCHFKFTS